MADYQEIDSLTVQRSFEPARTGTLYLVGTPIGNLEDMTYRAVRILNEVDEVAAEDTRHTRKLFTHFGIQTKLTSYHEHNKKNAGDKLIETLLSGRSIALVSDAGLPAISDPGHELVQVAISHQIAVVPVPGANAALSALIVSGLSTKQFSFCGFLPRDKKSQDELLEELKMRQETHLFYESPYRIEKTLHAIYEKWGNRKVVLARELTKKFEEIVRGNVKDCLDHLEKNPPKGEYCVVVDGASMEDRLNDQWWTDLTIKEHVTHYEEQGMERKQAIKTVAVERGVPKREVYQLIHQS